MLDNANALATATRWVGKTYAEMEALCPRAGGAPLVQWQAGMRGCWNLVREAYALRGTPLPEEYHSALDQRLFRTVFDPAPWDIVPICNHKLPIVTHVALVLPESMILHALESHGVVAQPLTREPWWSRIARDEKRRRGFLRLRT
jgi:cell wall-associated NlpC family hydrolase